MKTFLFGFLLAMNSIRYVYLVQSQKCKLSNNLKSEIRSYKPVIELIKRTVVDENGPLKNTTWTGLANFVDDFGSRLAGTDNLENAINFLLNEFVSSKLENVHGENATVPRWIRGEEWAMLTKPRRMKLPILGLGGSVGTPQQGLTASVIVFRSFEELKNATETDVDLMLKVRGKIVVYNEEYVTYGETVAYRSGGATMAAKLGAVAVLIRSIAPFSIASPHTGQQNYGNGVKIPAVCIAVEYAQMLQRLQDRGKKLEIILKMEAHEEMPVTSRNAIAEIVGKTKPEEIVLVSGHIDSWDVGQGAMDDGGGAFIAWRSLVVLKTLELRARRTIRSVLWTAEEEGYIGARNYKQNHANDMNNFIVMIESDEGTFTPTGLEFYGSEQAVCILQEIAKLLRPFNASILKISPYPVGSDIELWQKEGIPGLSLKNKNEKYFWYHHSEGDMMTVENSLDLDLGTAVFAAISYVIADLSVPLPKNLTTSFN